MKRYRWILFALLAGGSVCAAAAQTSPTGAPPPFRLEFSEKEDSPSYMVTIEKAEVKFLKEPAFGMDQVLRQAIRIGPGKEDYLGFAADFSQRKLYLDLNRNLDLTDDPEGIHSGTGSSLSVTFRDVRLDVGTGGAARRYMLGGIYLSRRSPSYLTVRSAFVGTIELHGRRYRLTVKDNLDGIINAQDSFTLRPVPSGSTQAEEAVLYSARSVPAMLFLDGCQYRLGFDFVPEPDAASLAARLTEMNVPLGELRIEGQFIRRLVLQGESLVLLDSPGPAVMIPEGQYQVRTISVQSGTGSPLFESQPLQLPKFPVYRGSAARLKIGGPLQSSVVAASAGSMLDMRYVLKGAGGEEYGVNSSSARERPGFRILRGGRELAAGKFEFG